MQNKSLLERTLTYFDDEYKEDNDREEFWINTDNKVSPAIILWDCR